MNPAQTEAARRQVARALETQSAALWLLVEKLNREGYAIAFEPSVDGSTSVVRIRPVIVRVDRPATMRHSNGTCLARPSLRDAAAQLLPAIAGEIEEDAAERRAKLDREEAEFQASLVDGSHPRLSGEFDVRPAETAP